MTAPHPTRVVRFTLLAILLGVSLPFAVQSLVECYTKPEANCNREALLISTIAFILTALNFFHGKVVTLEDDDYNRALIDRPGLALTDYILNLLIVLGFVFMAFFLGKPRFLIITNLIIRVLDTILVIIVRRMSLEEKVRAAQLFWLRFNLFAIIYWVAWLFYYSTVDDHKLAIAIAFLILIVVDILLDYIINHELYFSMASNWGEMADFWDVALGEHGHCYHKAIIIPALKATIGKADGKKVLDVGCGNGAIARAMAQAGAKVVGVDKYESMLKVASSYATSSITYKQVDIEKSDEVVEEGNFDYVIACFTLQDCNNIRSPLQFISKNLKPDGCAIIIVENDSSFENTSEHTSTHRRWLDPPHLAGRGRRQMIFWEPWFIRLAQGVPNESSHLDFAPEQYRSFTTVTRHWSEANYLLEAEMAGLEQLLPSKNLQSIDDPKWAQSRLLRLYRIAPRFRMLLLRLKSAARD